MNNDGRAMDVLTMGRMSVDLYADQLHRSLADVDTFSKYLGGCPANVAVGTARLGCRTGLISRVGKDGFGDFLLAYLEREGISTRFVGVDERYRTALAFAAIFPPSDSHVLFYRDPCADTHVTIDDVDEEAVIGARLFFASGTALAKSPCRETMLHCLQLRKDAGRLNVLDVDWRPDQWESEKQAAVYYRWVLTLSDVVIANSAELDFAAGAVAVGSADESAGAESADAGGTGARADAGGAARTVSAREPRRAAEDILAVGPSHIVAKRGGGGAIGFTEDRVVRVPPVSVEVMNTLGAGDGFAAGYCYGLLQGAPLEMCLRYGNAAGAIVVSRHGCAPAMPTLGELQQVIDEAYGGQTARARA